MKRRPTHPGTILREMYLCPLNMSQEKLAEELHLSRATINRLCNSKSGITAGLAVRLGKAFNTTPQFWLNLQNAFDLWEVEQEEKCISINPVVSVPMSARGRLA